MRVALFRTLLTAGECFGAVLVDLVDVFRSCTAEGGARLSRSSVGDSCVDSCLTVLGDDPMTDLVLENFAVFGSDT